MASSPAIVALLEACIEQAVESGLYSRGDLTRHFPGVRMGLTTRPGQVVRFSEPTVAWRFLVSRPFWLASPKDRASFLLARGVVSTLLDSAIANGLLTVEAVVDAVGVVDLVENLPRAVLSENIRRALTAGDAGEPFRRGHLLGPAPIETLVANVPLKVLWQRIVTPLVTRHGLADDAPASFQSESRGRRAFDALLRTKTGMTMELDMSELLLEDDEPGHTGPSVRPPPLPPPLPRSERPSARAPATANPQALRAFLRSKTGVTMELRREDLLLDDDPRREKE